MVKRKENKARGQTVTELLFYMEQLRKDSVKVTLEQEPTGRAGINSMAIWRKSVPGRENSKYKGPEAGVCLECLRNIQEPSAAGGQWVREQWWENDRLRRGSSRSLVGHPRSLQWLATERF